jgi:hypothetical protein
MYRIKDPQQLLLDKITLTPIELYKKQGCFFALSMINLGFFP